MKLSEEHLLGIAQEKGKIIMQALVIINKLADSDIADTDGGDCGDIESLKELIIKARGLKTARWWDEMIKNK